MQENTSGAGSVYYINMSMPFAAGEVILGDSGICAKNVTIHVVSVDGTDTHEAITDFFGDFRVDGLMPRKIYTFTIEMENYLPFQCDAVINGGVNLGEIVLSHI